MQAVIYEIDTDSYEVRRADETVYSTFEDLVEELPDNSARYIVLSYPFTLADGRVKSPLVLVYWRPPTCGQASKMLYAGAVELFRDKVAVSKLIEVEEEEDFDHIEDQLK